MKIEDVLFRPHWNRQFPGRYRLLAEYLQGTEDVAAIVENVDGWWHWQTFEIWTDDVHAPHEQGRFKTKKAACRAAERAIVEDLGRAMTEQEILAHNQDAKRRGEPPLPLGYDQ